MLIFNHCLDPVHEEIGVRSLADDKELQHPLVVFGVASTDTVLATLGVVTTLDVVTADFGVNAVCLVITVSVVMGDHVKILSVGVLW